MIRRQTAAASLAAASLLGLNMAAIAVRTGSWAAVPVMSGSMRPGLQPGSVAIVERVPAAGVRPGDVIVFRPPGTARTLLIHRVVRVSGRAVGTKGDANRYPDPWLMTFRSPQVYRNRASIPALGWPAIWLRGPAGRLAVFLAAALLLALAAWTAVTGCRPIGGARHPPGPRPALR